MKESWFTVCHNIFLRYRGVMMTNTVILYLRAIFISFLCI